MNENVKNKIDELKSLRDEKNNTSEELDELDIKIQQLKQQDDYDTLGNLAYEYKLKGQNKKSLKCVKALIAAYKEKKNIPYALTCYVAGELSLVNKNYATAKKNYYLIIKNGKENDAIWKEKAQNRLEDVCLKNNDIETVECIFKDYKEGKCVFVEKDTNKTRTFKVDELLMWDVMPKDLVQLTIFHIADKISLVSKVEVIKKAKEVEEDKFISKLNSEIQNEIVSVTSTVKNLKVYEGELPYIFVSYSHKDASIVLPIIEKMQEKGFRVWFDRGIEAGSEWPQYIGEHIDGSECVVVCMSKNAEDSINCRNEINLASELNKNIIVIRLEEYQMSLGMRLQIGSKQAIHKYRHETLKSFIEELSVAKLLQVCK